MNSIVHFSYLPAEASLIYLFFASVQGTRRGKKQRTKMTCSKTIIYGGPVGPRRPQRSCRPAPARPRYHQVRPPPAAEQAKQKNK
jgi:hypothetical protein